MAIISISGKINSGKDTVGNIIKDLLIEENFKKQFGISSYDKKLAPKYFTKKWLEENDNWQIKKFGTKLKQIVAILLNCTVEKLEDREFKEKELGEEWWYWENSFGKRINYLDNCTYGSKQGSSRKLIKLTPRLLLQLMGTDCGRDIIHPDIWVTSLMNEYKSSEIQVGTTPENLKWEEILPNFIITDMRFPNEMEAVKKRGGITIKINRKINLKYPELYQQFNNEWRLRSEPAFIEWLLDHNNIKYQEIGKIITHESETALDNAEFDYVLENNSTIEELIEKIKEVLIKEKLL